MSIYFLVLTNAGSMNAYTRIQKDKWWKVEKDGEGFDEDDKEVTSFIKTSASVATMDHFLVMIVVITKGSVGSCPSQHYKSPEFLFKSSDHYFYWAMSFTMLLVMYQSTSLLQDHFTQYKFNIERI